MRRRRRAFLLGYLGSASLLCEAQLRLGELLQRAEKITRKFYVDAHRLDLRGTLVCRAEVVLRL
jgi:hypothetical protein